MATMNDRVRELRKNLELTQQEFAERIKLKSGNTFSMIEKKKSALTEQNILLICIPNRLKPGYTVNEDWLRNGGNAPMFIDPASTVGRPKLFDDDGEELSSDEEELIGIYRQLTLPNKAIAIKQIDVLLDSQDKTDPVQEKSSVKEPNPVYDQKRA
jgi:transcriptional regulator with XRE-family HTH domain